MQFALNKHGVDKQADIAIEEMSELTKAIIKHRIYATAETYANLVEEIADVMIMLEQIKYLLRISDTDINEIIEHKLNRQLERIGAENGSCN